MEVNASQSGIPPSVLQRCVGKQRPITPHAQRLLVAACSEAKSEGNGTRDPKKKDKGNKPKAKASAKSKAKAKPQPKKKVEKPNPAGANDLPIPQMGCRLPPECRSKTPYATAKDEFIKKSLGSGVFLGYI